MDLQAPGTLFTAWVLVPLAVVLASAGLGYGIALVSGVRLRALTIPTGFLAGIALFTMLFHLNVAGWVPTVLTLLLAAAGPLYSLRTGRRPDLGAPDARRGFLWAGLAALAAYAWAMAPLVGSGRSGILGYVLNDDSAIHVSLIEAIADGTTDPERPDHSSYHTLTRELASGYPVGSYAWPVFGRLLGGIEGFHLWTPLTAVVVAAIALVAYALLRTLESPRPLAGIAAVFASCGHLVYSYNAQGGAKELIMPLAVYTTALLCARMLDEGASGRTLIPPAIAAVAAVSNLGYAALAWVGPVAVATVAILVWRHLRGERIRNARRLWLYAAIAVVVGLPAAISSIRFFRNAQGDLTDPNEIGNLFDALSLWQPFGIWLTGDYRFKPTDVPGFAYTALGLALALGIVGLIFALRRRNPTLPLALIGGVAGALLIAPRTSIYYDAKTYVALAPALGMATAAGVAFLWRARLGRVVALLAGGAVAVGIVWSDVLIYQHAWLTPEDRLGELVEVADRFEGGEHRILVADREQYATYFLRELAPWDDWGYRQPSRGLRFAGNSPPTPPRAPDLDDYTLEHLGRFDLILERKSPEGSHAVSGFEPAFETAHYRVWRRTGPLPREHLSVGRDGQLGSALVRCARGRPVRRDLAGIARRAEAAGAPLVAALQPQPAIVAIESSHWADHDFKRAVPAPGTAAGRGGRAGSVELLIPEGRYVAWVQGSFGPGVRLYHRPSPRENRFVEVADVFNDLGAPGWHRVGVVDIRRRSSLFMIGIDRPWWLSGSEHFNIMGPLEIRPEGAAVRTERFDASDVGRLCGRRVDWVEIPA